MVKLEKTDLATAFDILHRIGEELELMNRKIDSIMEGQQEIPRLPRSQPGMKLSVSPEKYLDVMTLLSLPDHLRKTAMTACGLGEATADDVAGQTGRARAIESSYLNQLVMMGHLIKKKLGRKTYFSLER